MEASKLLQSLCEYLVQNGIASSARAIFLGHLVYASHLFLLPCLTCSVPNEFSVLVRILANLSNVQGT
ncbi:hypothetical protein Trydic_g8884 [Trypoxylus dichotomus]